jgi:NitT/TauT family transport system substrate-binding protein
MRSVSRVAAWLAAAVLALACVACRSRDQEPLLVTATPWVGNTPLMAARERQLFGKTEVRIVELSTDFDVWRAVREGRADVVSGTLFDILRFIDHGADLAIVMVIDSSNGADGIVARDGITRIQDLVGRRVAVEKSTLTHFVLLRALERAGMREDEISLENLATDEALAAMEQGRVDAAALWEPMLTQAAKPGRRVLFTSAEIPGEIIDVLAVRKAVLQERPDAVAELLRGHSRGAASFSADPNDAAETASRLLGLDIAEARGALERVEILGLAQNTRIFDESSPESAFQAYALAERFMREHGMLRHAARPASDILDGRPIARAMALPE